MVNATDVETLDVQITLKLETSICAKTYYENEQEIIVRENDLAASHFTLKLARRKQSVRSFSPTNTTTRQ